MAQLESMFGSPPEMVDLQIDRENQQWASRPGDAYQRMASAGSLAAQRGGTALGDAFGIVDPRKAMALKVQDALKEIKDSGVDLNQDPVEFYTAMSKAFASRGLMEQATQASMKAMELKDKSAERADKESSRANKLAIENLQLAEAQAKLEMAKKKAQGQPWEASLMKLIETGKYTPESLDAFADSGKFKDLKLVEKTDHGAGPASVDAGGRVYVRVSPEEYAKAPQGSRHPQLQNYIDAGSAPQRGTNVNVGAPDIKGLKTWTDVLNQGNNLVKEHGTVIATADKALALLKARTPANEALAVPMVISIVQGSKISDQDVKRYVNTGDISDRIANTITGFLSGTPTEATTEDRISAVNTIRKIAIQKYNKQMAALRNSAKENSVNPDSLGWSLADQDPPKGKPMTLPSGKTIYVE